MYKDGEQRDYEILEIYDIVYRLRRNEGKTDSESRAAAFEAIELRFGLSKSRSRIIIQAMRKVHSSQLKDYPSRFKDRVVQLLQILSEIKEHIK